MVEKYGMILNDKNEIESINYNIFVKYVLSHLILIYTSEGEFYYYTGSVYKRISNNEILRYVRDLFHEIIPEGWKVGYGNNVLSTLELAVEKVEELNTNPLKVNLLNGILNLETMKLTKHTPKFKSSIQLPITYDPEAKCKRFRRFLKQIFDEDKELVRLVQEIMGYCLGQSIDAQKAFIFLGAGANGKSVLLYILSKLVGKENISTLPLTDLESSFRRYALVGKTLNMVTEAEFKTSAFSTNHFKAIVSGDSCTAEIKGGALFTFQPTCKLVIALNAMPKVMDKSHGFKRRIIILPFDRIFKEYEQNKQLKYELEEELDGIFNFALKGLKRLRENDYNFTIPQRSQELMDSYFELNDPLSAFVKARIQEGVGKEKIPNRVLYEEYENWCIGEGIPFSNPSRPQFMNDLKNILKMEGISFSIGSSNGERNLKGIRWKK